jgi:hypothetical protein
VLLDKLQCLVGRAELITKLPVGSVAHQAPRPLRVICGSTPHYGDVNSAFEEDNIVGVLIERLTRQYLGFKHRNAAPCHAELHFKCFGAATLLYQNNARPQAGRRLKPVISASPNHHTDAPINPVEGNPCSIMIVA